MAASPTVSVIIPVFNRARFVPDAIRSILGQTLSDIEVIVVDDGSTDDTVSVVRAIADPRLRLVQHETNQGIPTTRNTGLQEARGEFIAWLDSDDVSRPDRLEEQVRFLAANPTIAMVGCCAGKIGSDGRPKKGLRVPPLAPDDVAAWLLFRPPFQQSSVTGRAEILKRHPYRPENPVCEDYDVFLRLAADHRLANLPRVLIDRRLHPNQTIRCETDAIHERKMALQKPQLERVGMSFTASDLEHHVLIARTDLQSAPDDFLDWAGDWLVRLRAANARAQAFSPASLDLATSFFWALACRAAIPRLGFAKVARAYLSSPIASGLLSRHGRAWLRQVLSVLMTANSAQSLGGRLHSRQDSRQDRALPLGN